MLKQFIAIILVVVGGGAVASAQWPLLSVSSDIGVQRSLKKDQHYFTAGNTSQAIIHLSPKDAMYVWFSFYLNGKFTNKLTATSKSVFFNPQQINYVNKSVIGLKDISIGFRKYLIGRADTEKKWNLYSYAGFGLVLGQVRNTHSVPIDTAIYNVPVRAGDADFKRLTIDLGLGWEQPLGGDYYLYSELRTWLPTTDYPSKYIFVNENAPLVGMIVLGIRILF